MGFNALLVSDDVNHSAELKSGLIFAGAQNVTVTTMDESWTELLSADTYDLLVLECHHVSESVLSTLADLNENPVIPVICFTSERDSKVIKQSVKSGVMAFVVGDKNQNRMKPIVDVALARFSEQRALKKELSQLKDKLANRAIIEKAKGLLMQSRGISEDEAYHEIRRHAMNQGKRLSEVAEAFCATLISGSQREDSLFSDKSIAEVQHSPIFD
ncbi:ANTAR domain-containing protein [Hydrogenovibrio sp. 3SP14C1]|uniref:ANTAR domain-containing response regulator n=1 Tax=Hydrogenovibrio sp. 3SP14C1 TaxID=3038774 RepID=UPI00241793EC|nr:ANTAR domain-containing protein [Hydrogenovibrio sp. 3SP14C1]MDG4813123.1 ANTAR domain-containing protein [Hydrogenovibrio sp. 3SP14C1]